MEDWGYVDECELQNWKGGVVCMTCQHFIYGVDQHCHTMVGCNLRQKQLQQGQHLKKRCSSGHPPGRRTWAGRLKLVNPNGETRLVEVLRGLSQIRLPASRALLPSGCLPSSR